MDTHKHARGGVAMKVTTIILAVAITTGLIALGAMGENARDTVNEVLDEIIDDIDETVNPLPDTFTSRDEAGTWPLESHDGYEVYGCEPYGTLNYFGANDLYSLEAKWIVKYNRYPTQEAYCDAGIWHCEDYPYFANQPVIETAPVGKPVYGARWFHQRWDKWVYGFSDTAMRWRKIT